MTSLERRRQGRYERRKAARLAKKAEKTKDFDDFNNILSYKSLIKANKKSMRNVSWKASVQRYQMNLLKNIEETRYKLSNHIDITKGFVEFDIIERGKPRHIRSVHFSERVVQRSTCDNILIPMLRRTLIYDNNACLENKGVDQALDRMDAHLQQFYRYNHNSNKGYAVLYDFSSYFDGILHSLCFDLYDKYFNDPNVIWLLQSFVLPFGYKHINSHHKRIIRGGRKDKGNQYSGKSLGLGSQVSQITAIAYPSFIDHYFKDKLGVRVYGRYMDDGYMFFKSKKTAFEAIRILDRLCSELGIKLNTKKTQVVKLSRGIPFLKVRHVLTDTGKVKRYLDKKSITKERRKFKKFFAMMNDPKANFTLEDVSTSYGSWKGYALHRGGLQAVRRMDKLYKQLFNSPAPKCRLQYKNHKIPKNTSKRRY